MTQPLITKVALQGFRSFGTARQSFDLPVSVAVVWGGNSQGKTSFSEALEFLFSGQIARRELLASAKDEFAEALRNAHSPPNATVVVEAHIKCVDGQIRRLSRTLVEDYKRGNAAGCASQLHIDGKPCVESDLEGVLGLRLSHPPLRAPILAQHTLGYLFSASPTDRAAYFRAILDTQDLEDFRSAVAALQPLLVAPDLTELKDLAEVETIAVLATSVGRIRRASSEDKLKEQLISNTSALLKHIGLRAAVSLVAQVDQIEAELNRRWSQTFPIEFLRRAMFSRLSESSLELENLFSIFFTERGKVDAETQRLLTLFKAALAIPPHEHESKDCPLCGAADTFDNARVNFIRERVGAAESYVTASDRLVAAVRVAIAQLDALLQSVNASLPRFLREGSSKRRSAGFTVAKISLLIPDQTLLTTWLKSVRLLIRSARDFSKSINKTRKNLEIVISEREKWTALNDLKESVSDLIGLQTGFEHLLSGYESPARSLGEALKAIVDKSADTNGWESLIRLARNPAALWKALLSAARYSNEVKSLEKALRDIDLGNGKVLDEKFSELSNGVRIWWDKLRPNETTFFEAVQRRSDRTRRTIDLKAGLSTKDDRSDVKFRDAVAVFSQSQLHCLGLSLFLARAVQEKVGFVVLDDPVLTSDDDYRPNFASSVIEGLLDADLQVIICTQDHKSWKDIGDRWGNRGAVQFQMVRNDALRGTEIRSQNDDLATMLAKAQPLTKSQDPAIRKEGAIRLREAIERFCKHMLVKDRQANGDSTASITDYDGKNFGNYSQQVMNMLNKDSSHPGKLKAAHSYVTPGPHDDKPPSAGELVVAYGDLKKLKSEYLD